MVIAENGAAIHLGGSRLNLASKSMDRVASAASRSGLERVCARSGGWRCLLTRGQR